MSPCRSHTFLGLAICAVMVVGGPLAAAQREFSSANRHVGRAAVEYRDEHIHVVAAYYYSQRNHDSRWILIESGISTTASVVIARSDIALRTPAGREIPLATQEQVGQDTNRIQALLQNARTVSHNVLAYFPQRDRAENMQLFTLPFGDVVHNDFVVDRHRVAAGRLFFASPTGAWERGTYALVVRHPNGVAELPIRLER